VQRERQPARPDPEVFKLYGSVLTTRSPLREIILLLPTRPVVAQNPIRGIDCARSTVLQLQASMAASTHEGTLPAAALR
jgi:hypothetical protein